MPLNMGDLKIGFRYMYKPASYQGWPTPVEVVSKPTNLSEKGTVLVRFMSGHEQRVSPRSLHMAEKQCRECGCIDDWACSRKGGGPCAWVRGEPEDRPLCTECHTPIVLTGQTVEDMGGREGRARTMLLIARQGPHQGPEGADDGPEE